MEREYSEGGGEEMMMMIGSDLMNKKVHRVIHGEKRKEEGT